MLQREKKLCHLLKMQCKLTENIKMLSLPGVGRAEVHSTIPDLAFSLTRVPVVTPRLCLCRPRPKLRLNCSKFSLLLEFLAGSAAASRLLRNPAASSVSLYLCPPYKTLLTRELLIRSAHKGLFCSIPGSFVGFLKHTERAVQGGG